jgi:hypothetical protein
MVIGAIPERLDLKRDVFGQLDELAEADAILASNSSSIPDQPDDRHRSSAMSKIPQYGLVPFHVRRASDGFIFNRGWAAIKEWPRLLRLFRLNLYRDPRVPTGAGLNPTTLDQIKIRTDISLQPRE